MNHRLRTIALSLSGVLAIAGCAANPHDGAPNARPAAKVGADPLSAWQVYYDVTHPDPSPAGRSVAADPLSAWQVYYDVTHPDPSPAG